MSIDHIRQPTRWRIRLWLRGGIVYSGLVCHTSTAAMLQRDAKQYAHRMHMIYGVRLFKYAYVPVD